MAIPVVYNLRSVKARWTSAIVAVLGIAGTVGVFVAMLSLARGFKATLVSSGSEDNAMIMRAGATSEMTGGVGIDTVKIVQDAPGIARGADGPLVTAEVVMVAPIPLISTGTDANVQLRGDLIPREATRAQASHLERIDIDARTAQCFALLPCSADAHVDALPNQIAL